jgi:predicted permease
MQAFGQLVALTAPLFALVVVGYALARFGGWRGAVSEALASFVFSVAVPALLFRLMSDFSSLPRVDPLLLVAYFGGTLIVYAIAMLVGRTLFRQDGVTASVFGMGGTFANTVLLGLPLARVALGDRALPAISLVIVFHSLILWTLVTVSVEWARHQRPTLRDIARTLRDVVLNPVVASILVGAAYGFTGLPLPGFVDQALRHVADSAVPLSLIALGMSLADYGIREGWRESAAMTALKLVMLPLVVYGLARAIGLPPIETQAITLLAAMPAGANVYVMSKAFQTLGAAASSAVVVSTALSAITAPIVIALTGGVRVP